MRLIGKFGPVRLTIPIRAVTNRVVHHEIHLNGKTVSCGPRPDWSWQDLVAGLNGRVTVYRGKGRHRRIVYETKV